ncbi:MAG: ferritin-like domain-containing protein [Acidimicrobiales bacterium]|nr:ferritin-like domain-containing protein [Acidimicrobiales bacterium]
MPIDQSTPPAAGTSRRTFLVRSALGGALAAAGVAAPTAGLLPFGGPISFAGAQDDDLIIDADYAGFAIPLELAAVQAYEKVLATTPAVLDDDATAYARAFQSHHQSVATTLATLLAEGADTPSADEDVAAQISATGDAAAIAGSLASLEDSLAATHLAVIPQLRDAITAKLAAQIAGIESQQATVLGLAAGTALEALTPAEAPTEAAIEYAAPAEADATDEATTTEAGADTTTTEAN